MALPIAVTAAKLAIADRLRHWHPMSARPRIDRRSLLRVAPVAGLIAAADTVQQGQGANATPLPAHAATLSAGRYRVDRDMLVSGDMLLLPGAQIDIAADCTLTFTGDLQAPASRVFTGAGRVDLNRSRVLAARPEWWGAVTDELSVDCLAAIQACIAAHSVVALVAGDYHIADTLRITLPNRLVEGRTGFSEGRTTISRLVLGKSTGDVVQVGPDRQPLSAAGFLPGIRLRGFELARSVAVTPAPAGQEARGPAGLRVQYATACQFDDLTSMEHANGYVMRATVRSFLRNCSAFRSRPGTSSTSDVFVGFLFDGNVDFGAAGGNASLYAIECVASTGGAPGLARSIGAYLPGAFADLFLVRFEMASMTDGIVAQGTAGTRDPHRLKWGNGDLHLVMPILDNVARTGIELADLSPYALVDIVEPYVSVASSATAAIMVRDGGGAVTVTGGQLIGWNNAEAGGTAHGVLGSAMSGLALKGVKLLGWQRPAAFSGCRDLDLDLVAHNPDQSADQAAVRLTACERVSVRARVTGKAGAFPAGVLLEGTANQRIAVDATGIDPDAIAGGAPAGAKLIWNGTPVRTAGPFGSHVASGIMI